MSELTINMEKLKQIAVVWKRKHPAIESIRLVYATHYLTEHNYYKAILIAIVPKPDEDYLDWVKDPGASHIRNEVEQFGLEEVMWLTCKDIAEAEEWVIDLTESRTIRDNGVGSSIRLGRTLPITSAGRIKIKSPPFYKSGEGLKVIIVRSPSITSADGADIVWVNLTGVPDMDKASEIPATFEEAEDLKGKDQPESELEPITPEVQDIPAPAPQQVDPEVSIGSLQVSYVDPVTISIIWLGKAARQWKCKDLGIKEGAKTWLPFKEALTSPDNTCHVSKYDINKDPIKVKQYNLEVQRINNFSEKFVAFLNREYSASLPADFSVFENMKNRERAGTYKPKFQVVKNIQNTVTPEMKILNPSPNVADMDREDVLNKISALIRQTKREKDEEKQNLLLEEVLRYAQHARKMHWIDEEQLRSYITLPDPDASQQDVMSGAERFMENALTDDDNMDVDNID